MEQLMNVLKKFKPDVNFASSADIVKEGLLSSLDIMMLIVELNNEFDIEIGIEDLRIENFMTVETIWAMVQRLQ